MKPRLYASFVFFVALALLIAACGGGAEPTATPAPPAEPTEAAQAAEPTEAEEATAEPTEAEEATEAATAEDEEATVEATEATSGTSGTAGDATTEATAEEPTEEPTEAPTEEPTAEPTEAPTDVPTEEPTAEPTEAATDAPTEEPTAEPTEAATDVPTEEPTAEPTEAPTEAPTDVPTEAPTDAPTDEPTAEPTADTGRSTRVAEQRAARAAAVSGTATARAVEPAATEEETTEATEESAAEPTEDTLSGTTTAVAAAGQAVIATQTAEAGAMAEATEVPAEEATSEGEEAAGVDLRGTITNVCLVTDIGRVNDGTFNQFAFVGMERAAEEFNLTSNFIETVSQADYAANLQTCLDDGFQAIVTVGFLIADATRAAAEANPDVYFIGVDQFFAEPLPNLVGIQFREDQSGFLAGVMAALMTESDIIAGVYGAEIPPVIKFRNGFEQGAKYINPDITTLGVYIPDFLAPAQGAEAAEAFIAEGADVIFGAGGPTGSGGITRAAELGVKVIGVDQDEFFTTFGEGETPGAENLITSAVKRVDQGVYDLVGALSAGEVLWPTSSLYLMDAAADGVGFAEPHLADVPEEVTAQVQAVFEMLASGELNTGVDPVSGALLEE